MAKTLNFCKRNFKELLRDPLLYVFCLGFPLVMFALFQIINKYTNTNNFPNGINFGDLVVLNVMVNAEKKDFELKKIIKKKVSRTIINKIFIKKLFIKRFYRRKV